MDLSGPCAPAGLGPHLEHQLCWALGLSFLLTLARGSGTIMSFECRVQERIRPEEVGPACEYRFTEGSLSALVVVLPYHGSILCGFSYFLGSENLRNNNFSIACCSEWCDRILGHPCSLLLRTGIILYPASPYCICYPPVSHLVLYWVTSCHSVTELMFRQLLLNSVSTMMLVTQVCLDEAGKCFLLSEKVKIQ